MYERKDIPSMNPEFYDPKCNICGSKKSEHVKTDKGPFTHPREAAGEGTYVRTGFGTIGMGPGRDDEEWENWKFVPTEQKATG